MAATPPSEKYPDIGKRAAEQLGRMVDGNGLRPDQIRVNAQSVEVHALPGTIKVRLVPKVAESQRKGNAPQGQVLGSKHDVLQRIEGLEPEFLKSHEILQKISALLEQAPGKGWGMPIARIPLPETRKEFSVIDKCTKCSGAARVSCTVCNTTGVMPCQNCFGQGLTPCLNCQASGQVLQADGARIQCFKCLGRGRITCFICQNIKTVPCTGCDGQGYIGCGECNMSGYWTHIYTAIYETEIEFIAERSAASPALQRVLEKLPLERLGIDRHAEIYRDPPAPAGTGLAYPMVAELPVATVEFSVEGKSYPAIIAGLRPAVVEVEPFLDTLIKPGLSALQKLSQSSVAASALIETACKYRIFRQVLSELASESKRTTYQKLIAEYPAALSEKYANATVRYAAQVLLNLGRKHRLTGLAIGTFLSLGLFLFYYHGSLRTQALQILLQKGLERQTMIVDLLVWIAGYLLTLYLIKIMAARALRQHMPDAKTGPAGTEGLYALPTTFLAFLAVRGIDAGAVTALLKKFGL